MNIVELSEATMEGGLSTSVDRCVVVSRSEIVQVSDTPNSDQPKEIEKGRLMGDYLDDGERSEGCGRNKEWQENT